MFNYIKSGKHIFCVNNDLSVVLCFHNMVVDVKLCRFQDVPWGFRLTGGADFDVPLTVVKITEGGIADQAGLKVGDVIVRINDVPTITLNHHNAHEIIMGCANTFVLGVIRPDEECQPANGDDIATNGEPVEFDVNENGSLYSQPRPDSQAYSEYSELTNGSNGVDSISGELEPAQKITDDRIAEIMSGEAEVLKDHNVIGVNFQRIIPKAGLFKSSEVFRQLNEEVMKSRADKEKEKRRWTTFLQKPNRPIPKTKEDIQRETREPYRVKIVKQPKPRCDPNRIQTPPFAAVEQAPPSQSTLPNGNCNNGLSNGIMNNPNVEINGNAVGVTENTVDNNDENLPADDEVPDLEQCNNDVQSNKNTADEATPLTYGNGDEQQQTVVSCSVETENNVQSNNGNGDADNEVAKGHEDLLLEKQLADVQQQLIALSTLPQTIQATLDAVTKQISEILPNFKLRTSFSISTNITDESKIGKDVNECIELTKEREVLETRTDGDQDQILTEDENLSVQVTNNEITIKENGEITYDVHPSTPPESAENVENAVVNGASNSNGSGSVQNNNGGEDDGTEISELTPEEQVEKLRMEKTFRKQEEVWLRKREKEQKQLDFEQQQRLIAHQISKRPVKPLNGPRTPQERPLVLPGGRKWRNPKDAYNEEFIAEVISSQAELICGSTLGNKYESPLLGYDDRVNFLKYKKPEKDLSNLDKSEVFKIIHHLEDEPKHGIPARPEKVLAADDIRVG